MDGQIHDRAHLFRIANAAQIHGEVLEAWRNLLPKHLAWGDDDPPATDLNVARLRAKFYGGYYMILRPFLYIALHDLQFQADPQLPDVLNVAKRCVEAAIQSTIAFDNVGAADPYAYKRYVDISKKRLLVTNIFGTLHA
jgi:hypothetical protein